MAKSEAFLVKDGEIDCGLYSTEARAITHAETLGGRGTVEHYTSDNQGHGIIWNTKQVIFPDKGGIEQHTGTAPEWKLEKVID